MHLEIEARMTDGMMLIADPSELSVPGSLRKGDIRTHMLFGLDSTIMDATTTPPSLYPDVTVARERGVLYDVGHGQGSYSWSVGEVCAKQEFWPDTISTDHHKLNVAGPAYDLPTVMTKLLHLGMPLYDVIKAVTWTPALVIRKESEIGSLSPGKCADVTVLKLSDCDVMLEDCHLERRRISQRLEPIAVWRCGERVAIEEKWTEWPNRSEEYLQLMQNI